MKRIAILGSTGSIGQSALAVVDAHADRLKVVALAAGENADLLASQVVRYQPSMVALASGAAVDRLFPKPEAERLGKLLDGSMARPQEQRVVLQRLPR